MKGLILFGRVMNVYIHGNATIAQDRTPIYYVVLHNLSRPFRFCHVCCTSFHDIATTCHGSATRCHVDDKITPVHRRPVEIFYVPRQSRSPWQTVPYLSRSTKICHVHSRLPPRSYYGITTTSPVFNYIHTTSTHVLWEQHTFGHVLFKRFTS